jgi:hypothetical protein
LASWDVDQHDDGIHVFEAMQSEGGIEMESGYSFIELSAVDKRLLAMAWIAVKSYNIECAGCDIREVFVKHLYSVSQHSHLNNNGTKIQYRYDINDFQILIANLEGHPIVDIPETRIININSIMHEIEAFVPQLMQGYSQQENIASKRAFSNLIDNIVFNNEDRMVMMLFSRAIIALYDDIKGSCNRYFGSRFSEVPIKVENKLYSSASEYLHKLLNAHNRPVLEALKNVIHTELVNLNLPESAPDVLPSRDTALVREEAASLRTGIISRVWQQCQVRNFNSSYSAMSECFSFRRVPKIGSI